MLRRVALVITEISEELRASFIRARRIGEPGTMLAVTSNRRTLMKKALGSSETWVLTRATRRNIPEDHILPNHASLVNEWLLSTGSFHFIKMFKFQSSQTLICISDLCTVKLMCRATVARSVYRLVTDWTTEESEFDSQWDKEFSLHHIMHIAFEPHPGSYPAYVGVNGPQREADRPPPTSA
jgi:hypothetical protein